MDSQNAATVVVTGRRAVATGVVEFELARPDGSRLPDWAPGAHVDLILPGGGVRQYSLCGDRWDAARYRVAVQREPGGRGGSAYLHDRVAVGDELGFGGPRNTFRLAPADDLLFIAGGIGITPLLPMIVQAELLEVPWRLLYLGRQRERMAYLEDLARFGERVSVHDARTRGAASLEQWRPSTSATRVYACGPARLLDAIRAWGAVPGGLPPVVERFAAAATTSGPATRFEAVAARSGLRLTVEPDESLAAALGRAGVRVVTSCGQGVCGTCETEVLEGEPDHRDTLLDEEERRAADCMFPCVSRSKGPRLVLDL